jgi:excisionase family DNA binding protein
MLCLGRPSPYSMAEEALSIKRLAKLLLLSERTVCRLANVGEVPGLRVGKTWRFPRSGVELWMEQEGEKTQCNPSSRSKGEAKRREPPA